MFILIFWVNLGWVRTQGKRLSLIMVRLESVNLAALVKTVLVAINFHGIEKTE